MTILFAILLFSLLIFVHELGHFIAAKLSGVRVNEFSMFMGPAIFQWQKGETQYSIRCIPIGGFCAMEGEDEDTDDPRSFQKAAWWKRFLILIAGSVMNLLLGLLLMLIVYLPTKEYPLPTIDSFEDFSTVDGEHGLQVGDRILEIDGEDVYLQNDFSMLLALNPSVTHDVVVERNGKEVYLNNLRMETHTILDEQGQEVQKYGINFAFDADVSFGDKVKLAWFNCLDNARMVRLSLKMLITGEAGLKDMTGPVGIVKVMSDTASQSDGFLMALLNMLYFGAFLAINLGIMNLLPIPALDGGRVVGLFLTTIIEKITGKKLNSKVEGYIHGIGMLFLLGLMAIILFKDVFTIFKG